MVQDKKQSYDGRRWSGPSWNKVELLLNDENLENQPILEKGSMFRVMLRIKLIHAQAQTKAQA